MTSISFCQNMVLLHNNKGIKHSFSCINVSQARVWSQSTKQSEDFAKINTQKRIFNVIVIYLPFKHKLLQ